MYNIVEVAFITLTFKLCVMILAGHLSCTYMLLSCTYTHTKRHISTNIDEFQ